jgi:hypothetical protein
MKTNPFLLLITVGVWLSIVGCAGKNEIPLLSPLSADDGKLGTMLLVYRHTLENSDGTQTTARQTISADALWDTPSPPENTKNIFGILSVLGESARIRDIKKVSQSATSLIVLQGLQLIIDGQRVTMDASGTLETLEAKPKRFTFSADTEGLPTVQQFVMVYQWGDYSFGESSLWIPVEIEAEYVILRAGVEKRFSELWVLETMHPANNQNEIAVLR